MDPAAPSGTSQTPTTPATARTRAEVEAHIHARLLAGRNADGGWPYRPGKRSRIEATCWALLALGDQATSGATTLRNWPRSDQLLVDVPSTPVNYAFNALAAFTLLADPATQREAEPIVRRIVAVKGKTFAGRSDAVKQNNQIEAWSWIEGTACWVEPTAWCLLLLKKRREAGTSADADARIATGEALLFDRMCRNGGWNYGNPNVYGKDLWPYVPTTALALMALQDRADHPGVQKSLIELRSDVRSERSVLALALSVICTRLFEGRSLELEAQLIAQYVSAGPLAEDDLLATAMMAVALSDARAAVFALKPREASRA